MAGSGKIALRYTGPAQQVCYALAEHGYPAILNRETSYELPEDLAESLLVSNKHFVRVDGYLFPPTEATPTVKWRFSPDGSNGTSGTGGIFAVTASSTLSGPDPEQNQGE